MELSRIEIPFTLSGTFEDNIGVHRSHCEPLVMHLNIRYKEHIWLNRTMTGHMGVV